MAQDGVRTRVERGIFKRNNRYQVLVGYRDRNGHPRQVSGMATSLAEARRLRRELTAAALAASKAEPKPLPVSRQADPLLADWLDEWYATWPVLAGWSPSYVNNTRYEINLLRRSPLAGLRLSEITTRLVDEFYVAELRRGRARASLESTHTCLSGALKRAVELEMIPMNPCRMPAEKAKPVRKPQPPTVDEVRKLLAKAEDWMPVFLAISAATGARRGEVCGLRFGDVGEGVIHIRQVAVIGVDATVVKPYTKNGTQRSVAVDAATAAALTSWRLACAERALRCGVRLSDASYVFSAHDNHHKPLRPDTVSRGFRRLCAKAGISGLRLHDLRHFHATQLVQAGWDYRNVAERLGHDPRMTIRLYAHPSAEIDRQMAAGIGSVIWGSGPAAAQTLDTPGPLPDSVEPTGDVAGGE